LGGMFRTTTYCFFEGVKKVKKIHFVVGFTIVSLFFFVPVVFAADGFGQYTTGGAGGTIVTVTTAADFTSYVESNTTYIVQVSGTIDLDSVGGEVEIRSNKTIRGAGPGAKIIGQLGFRNGSSNVIIERLTITNPNGYGEGDGISVKDDIINVFITRCTIYDCDDGCLDISNGSDYVTVSWCKFYYVTQTSHRNTNLIGSSDGATEDMSKLHVTFHHNWWGPLCTERLPSVRYGRAHVYNNYYSCSGNSYCVRTRLYAECLVENNYFEDVQNPWERLVTDAGGDPGKLLATGNILINCTWDATWYEGVVLIPGTDNVFTPPYSYTLDRAKDVPVIVQYGAGADGNDGFLPHWFFGPYGDFDHSDIVDINDLETFVDYWLDTNDITDINDAEYNGDGIVNGYEYALFADNWLQVPPDLTAPAVPDNLWASGADGAVSLDWDDNSEEDLDGYNVYRSTTSGSGYIKLNDSILSSSDYTDNDVTNGITYYYVVTAVDTSTNESAYSGEVSATPGSIVITSITIQENTIGFCSVDGDIESEHSGYTGSGYANTENALGSSIDWRIIAPYNDTYTFTWRFANGSSNRLAKLLINGLEEVSSISFPSTGAWTNWSEVSVDVSLTAGVKNIRLQATGSSGLANIDYLMVTGPEPQVTSCP